MNWSLHDRIYVYSFIEGLALILGWTSKRIDFCNKLYDDLKLSKENSSELGGLLGKLPLEVRLNEIKRNNTEAFVFTKKAILDIITIENHNKFSPLAELTLLTLSKYLL